jgi:hypothetical protein
MKILCQLHPAEAAKRMNRKMSEYERRGGFALRWVTKRTGLRKP